MSAWLSLNHFDSVTDIIQYLKNTNRVNNFTKKYRMSKSVNDDITNS